MTAGVEAAQEGRVPWWHGVGSPGIGGYVLADLASVAALAVMLPLEDVTSGGLGGYLAGVVFVGLFGFFYSIPLALVGIPIVHFSTLRVRNQAVHVLAAGLVGFLASVVSAVVFGGLANIGDSWGFGLLLGCATAIGRAAVIPLARRRW